MKKHSKYNVIVSASDTVKKEFYTLNEVITFLNKCQGRCAVDFNGKEIFYGTVEQAVDCLSNEE